MDRFIQQKVGTELQVKIYSYLKLNRLLAIEPYTLTKVVGLREARWWSLQTCVKCKGFTYWVNFGNSGLRYIIINEHCCNINRDYLRDSG